MARNLVLCLDGTGDEYAAKNTNVVKLYAMLDRTRSDQLAYYQPGIGTIEPLGVWDAISRYLVTRVDLAIAWLLPQHVADAYRFLMRYYQQGDRIFIFGFSRGAYTARALAGMLFKVGLLTQGNEELIPFAWKMFKKEREKTLYLGFKETFSRDVGVHFLGLWDTVSSIGWVWDPQHLPYTANNPGVEVVRHAVALDERRVNFVQHLWGQDPGTDVRQLWFAGCHGDVGGGYAENESGLSKIALQWIVEEAKRFGLIARPATEAVILPAADTPEHVAPNPAAKLHRSLQGKWWIAEYLPRPYRDPAAGYRKRWMIHAGRPRFVPPGSSIHPSVYERRIRVADYDPPNLPAR